MSTPPETQRAIFEAQGPAREISSRIIQGFAAAGGADDPHGHKFGPDEEGQTVRLYKEIFATVHAKVREARGLGLSVTDLHQYAISGADESYRRIHRAACERLMAAINQNPEHHAWVEPGPSTLDSRVCRLRLDFSRLHTRSLTVGVDIDR